MYRAVFMAAAFACALLGNRQAMADSGALSLARKAVDAYETENYSEASALYSALTWGRASLDADVWYNAGNAHARSGKRGQAIAAYRRALELEPGHTNAAHNLDLLRGEVAHTQEQDAAAFLRWLTAPVQQVPLRSWLASAAGAWIVFWCVLSVRFWKPALPRWPILLGTAILAITTGGIIVLQVARAAEPRAIVVSHDAPLRTGPSLDYPTTHALPDGTECQLLETQAGWVQLHLVDGSAGWLEAERVQILPLGDPTPDSAVIVQSDAT